MPLLKKEQIKPGAVLEVLPVIKDGLPSFGMNLGGGTKEYLLLTPKAWRFLRRPLQDHFRHQAGSS